MAHDPLRPHQQADDERSNRVAGHPEQQPHDHRSADEHGHARRELLDPLELEAADLESDPVGDRRATDSTVLAKSSRSNVSSGWRYKVGAFALASAESSAPAAAAEGGGAGWAGMAARGPQAATLRAARAQLAMRRGFPTPSYFFL